MGNISIEHSLPIGIGGFQILKNNKLICQHTDKYKQLNSMEAMQIGKLDELVHLWL